MTQLLYAEATRDAIIALLVILNSISQQKVLLTGMGP